MNVKFYNTVSLRRLPHHHNVLSHIETSMDVPINGSNDPEVTLNYFLSKPFSLLIRKGPNLVGLVALSQSTDIAPGHWLTTTLLFPTYRGIGVNVDLKRKIAQSAQAHKIPLGAVVRTWNTRSISAVCKAFPNATGVLHPPHPDDQTNDERWFFDLENMSVLPAVQFDFPKLDYQIGRWWGAKKPQPLLV